MNVEPVEESVIKLLQRAVFAKVEITEGKRKQKVPRLHAYLRKLGNDVAQKKKGVAHERCFFIGCLDKQRKLDRPRSEETSLVASLIEKHERLAKPIERDYSRLVCLILPEIHAAYEAQNGELTCTEAILPHNVDLDAGLRFIRGVRRKSRAGRPYDVGRGKPPEASRWKPGQSGNPPKLARQGTWDEFSESLLEGVRVTRRDGGKMTRSRMEVEVAQTFAAAMEGDSGARRAVRGYIGILERKGMLSPPEPQKRQPRSTRAQSPEQAMARKIQLWLIARVVKRDILERYASKYGQVPEFETRVERLLAPCSVGKESEFVARFGFSLDHLARVTAVRSERLPVGGDDRYVMDFEHQARLEEAERTQAVSRAVMGKTAVNAGLREI